VYATPGSHLKSQFFPKIQIYMKKAISTANQGPRSKVMSKKNFGQKSRVSVPLISLVKLFAGSTNYS